MRRFRRRVREIDAAGPRAGRARRAFPSERLRRIFIVVAGPVFNLLFAIAVYTGLFLYGLPEPRPIVGEPAAGTFAHTAGLRAGDTVRSVGGEPIATWQELRWRVIQGALQRESLLLEVSNEREAIAHPSSISLRFPRRIRGRRTRAHCWRLIVAASHRVGRSSRKTAGAPTQGGDRDARGGLKPIA